MAGDRFVTDEAATGPAAPVRKAAFRMVFTGVAAGVAMSNADMFVVDGALPDIGRYSGGTSLSSLSWVLNAYAVVFAAWLIPAGRLADRTSAGGAYLFGIGLRAIPGTPTRPAAGRLDVLGAGPLTAGVAPLSLGLVQTRHLGWGSPWVIGSLVLAAPPVAWFVVPSAGHPSPILPLPRIPTVTPATIANFPFATAFGAVLPPRHVATGSAVVTMTRQIGSVLGVALPVPAPAGRTRCLTWPHVASWKLDQASG